MCPFSDSRQIYKNQFDKKEKEEKKKNRLRKNHSPTPILFRFSPFPITNDTFTGFFKPVNKYKKSKRHLETCRYLKRQMGY